jgi:hypothetical protein
MIQNYKPQRSTEKNLFYQTKLHLMELTTALYKKVIFCIGIDISSQASELNTMLRTFID